MNPSFIIALWLILATSCTGISKVYRKVFLNIPSKIPSTFTTIIFESPNWTNKFPKAHREAWSDVISFIILAAARPNPFIQSRQVRILRYTYWSGMYPGPQKSINTTTNGISDSIVWSNCCASWEHEFTNWQCEQALINWPTSLLAIGHPKRASILNYVLWSWLWPASGDMWHSYITTRLNLMGTTIRLSCITSDVHGMP